MTKSGYRPAPLGSHPEVRIRVMVLKNTLKLQSSASDLALRLSMGRELPTNASASPEQARLYKNFMTALSGWTMAS